MVLVNGLLSCSVIILGGASHFYIVVSGFYGVTFDTMFTLQESSSKLAAKISIK